LPAHIVPVPQQRKTPERSVVRIRAPLIRRVKPIEIGNPYIGSLRGRIGETPPYIGIVSGYIGHVQEYISQARKYIDGPPEALGTPEINRGEDAWSVPGRHSYIERSEKYMVGTPPEPPGTPRIYLRSRNI
jgi:hypothetical protein